MVDLLIVTLIFTIIAVPFIGRAYFGASLDFEKDKVKYRDKRIAELETANRELRKINIDLKRDNEDFGRMSMWNRGIEMDKIAEKDKEIIELKTEIVVLKKALDQITPI